MTWLKRIALGVGVLALLLVALPWAIGSRMSRDHLARGETVLRAPVERVWEVVSDFEGMAAWVPDTGVVKRIADEQGRPRFEDTRPDMVIVYTLLEVAPPRRLVVGLEDDAHYFGGTWTYELEPAPEGTRLAITERAWAGPGFFRFMLWLFGPDATIREYLAALEKKLGA